MRRRDNISNQSFELQLPDTVAEDNTSDDKLRQTERSGLENGADEREKCSTEHQLLPTKGVAKEGTAEGTNNGTKRKTSDNETLNCGVMSLGCASREDCIDLRECRGPGGEVD